MAILPIRVYPDPVLRQPAKPVAVIDGRLRQLAADMIETMEDANGVGLAAPQVGTALRLVIVDFDPENRDPRVLINPRIIKRCGRKEFGDEGCLSFPGLRSRVKRNPVVICEAQNLDGELVEYRAEGLPARAVQHELDHLDGLLFVDKVGPSDKQSLRDELAEMEQNYADLHQGDRQGEAEPVR
ncbi:MAG: peptide deformylase [Planctomycetes bacterium]|nr:peptide deformylase [Planctomycetota bacterium]